MTKKQYIIKYSTIVGIIVLVLVADLVTKHFFCDTEKIEIIPHLINFETNHGNDGMAFGMLSGKTWLLIIISFVFLMLIIIADIKFMPKSMLYNIAIAFIIGGAIGNLWDRIKLKYVRDFINFTFWKSFPTFNIADSFLCVGVVLISIYLVFFHKEKETNGKRS